jgi:hypothetical protein
MRKLSTCLLAVCLLFAGCSDDDDPTSPEDVLMLRGTVESDGTSRHDLSLGDSRVGRVTVSELRGRLIQVIPGFDPSIAVGFSLGRPNETDDCVASFSSTVAEGTVFVFGLEATDYCIQMFDTGSLPDDAIVDYLLSLTLE